MSSGQVSVRVQSERKVADGNLVTLV